MDQQAEHSDSLLDDDDQPVVDCMREAQYTSDADVLVEDPPDDASGDFVVQPLQLDISRAGAQVPPVPSPAEPRSPAGGGTGGTFGAVDGYPLTSAGIVGAALEEIVSQLAGAILPSAAPSVVAGTDPVNQDDHSYQWHAFQEDDEAGPVVPWVDDEEELVGAAASVDSGRVGKDASREDPSCETASGLIPTHTEVLDPVRVERVAPATPVRIPDRPAKIADPDRQVQPSVPDGPERPLQYESSEDPDRPASAKARRGGGWTVSVLCAGIGIIACCLLIPLCDSNRRAAYEKLRLRRDLEALQQQVATNDAFLHKVADDPTLAERLAQRQLHKIRAGTHIVPLAGDERPAKNSAAFGSMSPYGIVAVAPPAPLAAYKPVGGRIASLCYNAHTRLYLLGGGMMLMAVGLVMGYGDVKRENVVRENVKT